MPGWRRRRCRSTRSSNRSRRRRPSRVPGTAVFLTNTPGRVPHALLHNLKHNKVLHERVVLLTMNTRDIPIVVATVDRVHIDDLGANFEQIEAYFGFTERPGCSGAARGMRALRASFRPDGYVVLRVARDADRQRLAPGMALWRERLFVSMSKNATKASEYFNVPTNRVVELGAQVEL